MEQWSEQWSYAENDPLSVDEWLNFAQEETGQHSMDDWMSFAEVESQYVMTAYQNVMNQMPNQIADLVSQAANSALIGITKTAS